MSEADFIPLVDLPAQIEELRPALAEMFTGLLDSAAFVGGAAVSSFERAFAEYLGVSSCVGVASGTDALTLALRALEVGPGHEVVVPAFGFVATVEAVRLVGAKPRLVDVDAETALLDVEAVSAALTPRARAIIPVHLFGQMVPMRPLAALAEARGLFVLEDAAQAHGARSAGIAAGAHGHLAAFSFYPTKNLGGLGDGGAVVSRDAQLADVVRLLASHGRSSAGMHERTGTNSRLDAIQAGALSLRLARLDRDNEVRRGLAARYGELLAGVPGLICPLVVEPSAHVHHLYVIRSSARDRLSTELRARGIGSGVYYPAPIHLMPAHRDLGYGPGDFPRAEALANEVLALPLHPKLSIRDQDRIASVIRAFFGAHP